MAEEPISFDDHIQRQLDPDTWARNKASFLFQEISEVLGTDATRRVFAMWGTPPSPSKMRRLANESILLRLRMMRPKANLNQLAREIAHEKYRNPTPEEIANVIRHIRLLKAKRKPKRRG
ncbi:hypothetical protein UP10_14540 [Bradyrhizobium sp. LTSPM299]|uniref:hypothetical protein n=1 Tax=Bradyrhizobium sp. LTSPM299 TaxID=1619233 RepID=UPI0005C7E851|nr:hypothetical protein [Bradyrhizobium sp. LTSPM299]KJC59910.1 hypothetical protein UP10_14540 [Bradyrhizobium sp. LTSPM299]